MYSRDERKALESEEEPNRKREIVCGKKIKKMDYGCFINDNYNK